MRKLTVIGQDHQTFCIFVQSAHRKQFLFDVSRDILSQKIYDGLMYIILGCTDHISRFMQNIVMKGSIL